VGKIKEMPSEKLIYYIFKIHFFYTKYTTNTFTYYVLNINTLQLYFWYTKLIYLKSAKLKQLILCTFKCTLVIQKY